MMREVTELSDNFRGAAPLSKRAKAAALLFTEGQCHFADRQLPRTEIAKTYEKQEEVFNEQSENQNQA